MNDLLAQRRTYIISVSRELFETKGINATSMSDIAKAAELTRGALYRCFSDKEALVDAFLDDYVDDFVDCFLFWEGTRDVKEVRQSADGFIKILRLILFEKTLFRRRIASFERTDLYLRLINKAFEKLSDAFVENTYGGYKNRHAVEIDHVRETFYIMTAGMVLYVKAHPEADNEMLIDIMIQTLRLTSDANS